MAALGMNVAIAQTVTPSTPVTPVSVDLPAPVTTKFNAEYPGVTPQWQMDGDNYSAWYVDQKTSLGRTVLYDMNGNIVRTDNETRRAYYPVEIDNYYSLHHPSEEYKVWMSEDGKGNKTYYSTYKSRTLWFDKDGKYLSDKMAKSSKSSGKKKPANTTK